MLLYINMPPSRGSLRVGPISGVALSTNFTMHAENWADPEGDMPLSYAFYYAGVLVRPPVNGSSLVWVRAHATNKIRLVPSFHTRFWRLSA